MKTCKDCLHNEMCYATHTDDSPICCDFKEASMYVKRVKAVQLRDHKKIGEVVVGIRDDVADMCIDLANMAIDASTDFDRNLFIVRFKAYFLVLSALNDLICEYDFDCVFAGDEDE